MIAVASFKGKKLALFGLGGSGLATAKACLAGGADIIVWDDNAHSVERARAAGLQAQDLREIDWGGIAALVLSPGVPLTHPKPHWSAALAHKAGVEIIGDIELFVRERAAFLKKQKGDGARIGGRRAQNENAENFCPFIAITGTNGKSTTTALIAHILRQAGFDAQMGGNIGRPVLELDSFKPSAKQAYVVECSSYQIDLAPSLNPTIGILLNITPDHIDRHGSFENYAAIKERPAAQSQQAIIAYDDAPCRAVYDRLEKAGKKPIGIIIGETGLYKKNGKAKDKTEADFLQNAPALRGRHNAQNAGAAFFACRALGVDEKQIMAAMRNFRGLPHRMEEVGHLRLSDGEIEFINDSKATNAEATAPALQSFENIYWIAGGIAKQGGIESLTEYLPHVRKTYLIGEAAEDFAKMLDKAGAACILSRNLEKAVKQAVADAKKDLQKGDSRLRRAVILLAPACASFDQFKNFEERGKAFAALAEHYYKEAG